MTAYNLASFFFERDTSTYDYVDASNSVIQFNVTDPTTTAFSYTIIDPNPGGIPLIELSIEGGYSVLIDGVLQTFDNLRFYFGYVEWGAGNTSYIIDMMFNDDPDSVLHHIYQIAGDPMGIGADMTIAEMQALEMTITGLGAITSGVFAPGEFIPFSALAYLLDPNANVIIGTDADDVYYVADGSDWVFGGAGDDEIYGNDGNNELFGETGNDKISGGGGDDFLDGGIGNDNLHGDEGNDEIYGGDGDDRMFGGSGADYMEGGAGNDKIHASSGDDIVFGGDGADTILAGSGDDIVEGDAGNDIIMGQSGHDQISGGQGDDVITGGAGNDQLNGGDGNDVIVGGRGDDTISGGFGNDILTGSNGADTFVFTDTDGGTDVIKDFDASEGDVLDLTAYLLAHPEVFFTDTADFISSYVIDAGRDSLIDFGNGDTIELERVSSFVDFEAGLLL